jgi:hypothetical protein
MLIREAEDLLDRKLFSLRCTYSSALVLLGLCAIMQPELHLTAIVGQKLKRCWNCRGKFMPKTLT